MGMTNEQIITEIGFDGATDEVKEQMIDSIRQIVEMRVIGILGDLMSDEQAACEAEVAPVATEIAAIKAKHDALKESHKDKKDEEIPTAEKDELSTLSQQMEELGEKKKAVYRSFAAENKQVRQLIDLALLANNMLKGEALAKFVKRSVEMM